MNTIKVYLGTDGSTTRLDKDFQLYVGDYQNKLLNVFVPTSILAPDLGYMARDDAQTQTVASNAVSVGMEQVLSRSGKVKSTRPYYLFYVKTLSKDGVEYALFERLLPQEFTAFAGAGVNAPKMIINAVVTQFVNSTDDTPTVTRLITSQTVSFDVLPSARIADTETVTPSTLDEVIGRLNTLVSTKQNKVDGDLHYRPTDGSTPTVVGAINYNLSTTENNELLINELGDKLTTEKNRIDNLSNAVSDLQTGEYYVGQYNSNTQPMTGDVGGQADASTSDILTAYVQAQGETLQVGDVVLWVWNTPTETDRIYKCYYTSRGWSFYELPAMQLATNSASGLVQGTGGGDFNLPVWVNITAGKVQDILVKINGSFKSIGTLIPTLKSRQDGIIDGSLSVGVATKAISDAYGNMIDETYLTKTAGATKDFVQQYALPSQFNDISYLTPNGYTKDATVLDENEFDPVDLNSIGNKQIFAIEGEFQGSFELSSKNSASTDIWVSLYDENKLLDYVNYQFTLVTEVLYDDVWVLLSSEIANILLAGNNEPQMLKFAQNFDGLDNQVLKISDGQIDPANGKTFRQTLSVLSENSTLRSMQVVSNTATTSRFSLNTNTHTIRVGQGLLGEMPIYEITGTQSGNTFAFGLPADTQIADKTNVQFVLTFPSTDISGKSFTVLKDTQPIVLETPYANSAVQTTDNFSQAYTRKVGATTVMKFTAVVRVDEQGDITATVSEDSLTKFKEDIIGKKVQLDFNATLSNNVITAVLDSSVSDFTLQSNTEYLFHIYLPLTALTGDLNNSYTIKLKDKNNNDILLNCIKQEELGQTSTVGDLCQIQNYDVGVGYSWFFNGFYREVVENNSAIRSVYVDAIVNKVVEEVNATGYQQVYGIDNDGSQRMYYVAQDDTAEGGYLPKYADDGTLPVNDAKNPNEAVSLRQLNMAVGIIEYGIRFAVNQSSPVGERVIRVNGIMQHWDIEFTPNVGDTVTANPFDNIPLFNPRLYIDEFGNHFREFDRFYVSQYTELGYQYIWVCQYKADNTYRLPRKFYKVVDGAKVPYWNKVCISSFEGATETVNGTTYLVSKPDKFLANSITRQTFENYATNNNIRKGGETDKYFYSQLTMSDICEIWQPLSTIIYGTRNSQAIQRGVCDTDTGSKTVVAYNSSTKTIYSTSTFGSSYFAGAVFAFNSSTTLSSVVSVGTAVGTVSDGVFTPSTSGTAYYYITHSGNAFAGTLANVARRPMISGETGYSDQTNATRAQNGLHSFKLMGIENFYGNIWKNVLDCTIVNYVPYICKDITTWQETSSPSTSSNFEAVDYTVATSNGYCLELGYSESFPDVQLTTIVGASTSTYYCDYYYQAGGTRTAFYGGHLHNGSDAGSFSWSLNASVGYARWYLGSRLSLSKL